MLSELKTQLKLSNSTERAKVFANWGEGLIDNQGGIFWSAVTEEWCSFDDIPYDRFEPLFERFRHARPEHLVAHLPDKIARLYRGQYAGHDGLAWTADLAVAEAFAKGHRGEVAEAPIIQMISATRDLVAFTCDERDEREFVLFKIPTDDEIILTVPVT